MLHQSSGDGKWNKGNAELEKWKRAQAERDEREEYWMRLEQQRGAANNRKRVERGSAEEARQAGARRTQGKAFNPAHQFDQQNVQRLPQFNFCRHFNHLLFPGGREGLKT